jgi:hypothetical protein
MLAETYYHEFEKMAHCATVCQHRGGVLLACYQGAECTDLQHVTVEYIEMGKRLDRKHLPIKTGNCVLIPTGPSDAVLIFSYFTDTDGRSEPIKPVQRWMFCTNWKMRVRFDDAEIKFGPPELLEIQPLVGLLSRCAPIHVNSRWYLPLYREHDCYGVVATSLDGWNWEECGKIGVTPKKLANRFGSGILIQPTLWYDGKIFHSLSRDVSGSGKAWYSWSDDCSEWTKPIKSFVDNANNSLVAIHNWSQSPLLVWNYGNDRTALRIGRWDLAAGEATPIIQLNKFGSRASYPNYCFDTDHNLHIVHTESGRITHHVVDKEAIAQLESMPVAELNLEVFKWWNKSTLTCPSSCWRTAP